MSCDFEELNNKLGVDMNEELDNIVMVWGINNSTKILDMIETSHKEMIDMILHQPGLTI